MSLDNKTDIALLLIRLTFGFRLIIGTIDNVVSWERMLEFRDFIGSYGWPFPLVCAIVSVYAQLLSGLSWVIGYQVKLASLIMVINFLVAILGIHVLGGDPYLATAPAIHLFIVSIVIGLLGPGKFAPFHGRQ